jgi:hypothetical protein
VAHSLDQGEEKPERRVAMKSDGIAHELDRRPVVRTCQMRWGRKISKANAPPPHRYSPGRNLPSTFDTMYLRLRVRTRATQSPRPKNPMDSLFWSPSPAMSPKRSQPLGGVVLEDAKDDVGSKGPEKQIEAVHRIETGEGQVRGRDRRGQGGQDLAEGAGTQPRAMSPVRKTDPATASSDSNSGT